MKRTKCNVNYSFVIKFIMDTKIKFFLTKLDDLCDLKHAFSVYLIVFANLFQVLDFKKFPQVIIFQRNNFCFPVIFNVINF